jgi:hypothetical protein
MRIFACELDPLRDHAFLFCQKLLEANRERTLSQVKLIHMKEYLHGFATLHGKMAGVDEYLMGTSWVCATFKEMFKLIQG